MHAELQSNMSCHVFMEHRVDSPRIYKSEQVRWCNLLPTLYTCTQYTAADGARTVVGLQVHAWHSHGPAQCMCIAPGPTLVLELVRSTA